MKQIAKLMILTALAGPGCVALDVNFFTPKDAAPAVKEAGVPPPPPPLVSASQVNDKNAAEMLNALRDELDYAAAGERTPIVVQPAVKKP